MSIRIVLVRHGACAQMDEVLLGRIEDPPLDARGELQARALAAHFACTPALVLQSSPRRRARQTACIIAQRCQRSVRSVAAMDEVDFGHWAGQRFERLAEDAQWRQWNEARCAARTPAGEDMLGVQCRAVRHLRGLAGNPAGRTVLIVTHAEVIRAVVLYCLGAPADDYQRIQIHPASLTTLRLSGPLLTVERINERIAP